MLKKTCILSVISILLFFSAAGADFKVLSSSDWARVLGEMNIQADNTLLDRMTSSGDTLQKIESQTKGNLKLDNWISIFEKLNIKPKSDMNSEEWLTLFNKINLQYKPDPIINETPAPEAIQPEKPQYTSEVTAPAPQTQPAAAQTPVEQTNQKPETSRPEKTSKISLDLRDADIFSTLKLISQRTNMSIIVGNGVKGTVTIYLRDIDAFDAFKIILEINSLAYTKDGDVYKVITDQDYERIYGKKFNDKTTVEIIKLENAKTANIEKSIAILKSKIGQIISDPGTNSFIIIDTPENIELLKKYITKLDIKMDTRVYALNYAKIKDILDKVKNEVSPGTGIVQSDDRTNQLIITDYPDKISDITKLVASLDKRNHEVLIEAKIMQILLNDNFQMGVNWDSVFTKVNGSNISGEVTANLSASNPGASGIRLNVGTLASNNFTALYDILQTVGKTNMVSAPKIATMEGQEAKMLVGTKEAYVTTTVSTPGTGTSTTAENVTFIDVGVKLFVTPNVGDDGFITMKIRPEVSSVDRSLTTAQGNTIPIVRTSESETTVMVKDGVTIVIGGLMEERKEKTVSGIPLLCRIPILGSLFGRTSYITAKTELAILLTPHIITGEAGVTQEEKEKYKIKDK